MAVEYIDRVPIRESQLEAERLRIVRLCYKLTGNLDVAEDLAQETMLEAFRNAHKLHDPSGYTKWLYSIARNVCMRWNHRQGRDISRMLTTSEDQDFPNTTEDYDLDVELDRRELVALLDRAMAMLPPDSREVLVERYVNESSHAEIAERLGLTGPAVAKRLERGRLRLKSVLSTNLIHESSHLGIEDKLYDDWDETGMWCPMCGKRHLLAKFMSSSDLWLICKPCEGIVATLPVSLFTNGGSAEMYRGTKGYASALRKKMEHHWQIDGGGIGSRIIRCPRCACPMTHRIGYERLCGGHFAICMCESCRTGWYLNPDSLLLASPEGQAFWREHPRMRNLPEREIEAAGVPALLTGFESMTGSAKIEGIFVRDTFEPIRIHVMPGD